MTTRTFRIVLDCPDQVGIVTSVSEAITSNGGWISEAAHHSDVESNWFFSRFEVQADTLPFNLDELEKRFEPLKKEFAYEPASGG